MPPPIPLSGAAERYSAGSQSGSARSSANRGRSASQAGSGEEASAIVARTSSTNARTAAVSRTNSSSVADSPITMAQPSRLLPARARPRRRMRARALGRVGPGRGDSASEVTDVSRQRRVNDLCGLEARIRHAVEDPLSTAEQDRDEIEDELVDHSCRERLTNG